MDSDVLKISELKQNAQSSKSDNINKSKFNFMNLFSGKYLKIIILVIVLFIIVILYFSVNNKSSFEKSSVKDSSNYQTTLEYCAELESKLEKVLSQINGAGQVKVMLTVDGSPEIKYASNTDTKTSSSSNGTTTTSSSTPIIVNGTDSSNPLILTETLPVVKGVVIVASGASQINIKLDILKAVSTLLDISTDKISVLKGI